MNLLSKSSYIPVFINTEGGYTGIGEPTQSERCPFPFMDAYEVQCFMKSSVFLLVTVVSVRKGILPVKCTKTPY